MLGFPLGILSAAAAGFESDYELISTQVLGTAVSSIVFDTSSLGSTYKHLQIRTSARSSRTAGFTTDGINLRFNSDAGNNYARHGILGINSGGTDSISVFGLADQSFFAISFCATLDSGTAIFAGGVADILDPFSTTKFTTGRTLSGLNGVSSLVGLVSGVYRNTSAVTSIDLTVQSGNDFVAGSRFSLYGIRG